MPPGNAQRFRYCRKLIDVFESMGYPHEMGYQTFMYPSVADEREVLIWLVDRIPRLEEESDEVDDIRGDGALFEHALSAELRSWRAELYLPWGTECSECAPFETFPVEVPDRSAGASDAEMSYWADYQPHIVSQPVDTHQLLPSVFEHNALVLSHKSELDLLSDSYGSEELDTRKENLSQLIKDALGEAFSEIGDQPESGFHCKENIPNNADITSKFLRKLEFEHDVTETVLPPPIEQSSEETIEERRAKEEQQLNDQIAALQLDIEKQLKICESSEKQHKNVSEALSTNCARAESLQNECTVLKRVVGLLPDAERNMERLGKLAAESERKMERLQQEWDRHRIPLEEQIRDKRQASINRKDDVRRKATEIKEIRVEMRSLLQEIRNGDTYRKQLTGELSRLPKGIKRQVYVGRIMDVMKNLENQKVQIRKILSDVRSIQKEINTVTETSKRSFALVDDMMYKAAQNKQTQKWKTAVVNDYTRAYQFLMSLNENFSTLINTSEKTGALRAELRDIETRTTSMEARHSELQEARVMQDLKDVRSENTQLRAEANRLRGSDQ
eukprot:770358_1